MGNQARNGNNLNRSAALGEAAGVSLGRVKGFPVSRLGSPVKNGNCFWIDKTGHRDARAESPDSGIDGVLSASLARRVLDAACLQPSIEPSSLSVWHRALQTKGPPQ